jgi:hypothetical protein
VPWSDLRIVCTNTSTRRKHRQAVIADLVVGDGRWMRVREGVSWREAGTLGPLGEVTYHQLYCARCGRSLQISPSKFDRLVTGLVQSGHAKVELSLLESMLS